MTTIESKAGAAVAKAGKKAQDRDLAEDLTGQLVAQAREKLFRERHFRVHYSSQLT